MLLTFCCIHFKIFIILFFLVLDHKAIIAMAGAGFLLMLGLYTLLFKKIQLDTEDSDNDKIFRKRDYLGIYASGFLINTLNPSVFLFWFAWTAAIGTSAVETNNPIGYKLYVLVHFTNMSLCLKSKHLSVLIFIS